MTSLFLYHVSTQLKATARLYCFTHNQAYRVSVSFQNTLNLWYTGLLYTNQESITYHQTLCCNYDKQCQLCEVYFTHFTFQ